MCAGPKQSMATARNHSPQQVCVAETYTDVKGEGGRNVDGQRDDRTGGALSGKCRSTCGSGCGIEPTRSGGAAIMAKIKEGLGTKSAPTCTNGLAAAVPSQVWSVGIECHSV